MKYLNTYNYQWLAGLAWNLFFKFGLANEEIGNWWLQSWLVAEKMGKQQKSAEKDLFGTFVIVSRFWCSDIQRLKYSEINSFFKVDNPSEDTFLFYQITKKIMKYIYKSAQLTCYLLKRTWPKGTTFYL